MYCKNCGMKLENGTKFCGGCGMPVDNEIFEFTEKTLDYMERTIIKKRGSYFTLCIKNVCRKEGHYEK